MNTLEKHFKIRERGSSVRTEVLAGMTTFATMAYIIILQPVNMRDTGMDTVGILIATALYGPVCPDFKQSVFQWYAAGAGHRYRRRYHWQPVCGRAV